MSDRRVQALGQLTDNADLVADLVTLAERAPVFYNRLPGLEVPLREAMAALGKLHEAGYHNSDVDIVAIHNQMRLDLIFVHHIPRQRGYRRYIVTVVAALMRKHGIVPTTTRKGLFEKLAIKMLEYCGEEPGDIHRLAILVVKATKDSN